jgi:peptidoglycan-associated lipoprotein
MKTLVQKTLLLALGAAVALSVVGCRKKPRRPDPGLTVVGGERARAFADGLSAGTYDNLGQGGYTGDLGTGSYGNLVNGPGGQVLDSGSLLSSRTGIDDGKTIRGLLQPIYFGYDQSAIAGAEMAKLDAAKAYLDQNPQYRLLLEGHCDWRGTPEYNLGLGDRRAASAKQYLTTLGVPASKLEVSSKGDLEAVENSSDSQMANDRRAELVVIKQ